MDKNVKFTGEELTELEDIIGRSVEIHWEENDDLVLESELDAYMKKRKLLKSLHHKIQLMCIAYSEKELFAEEVQGLTTEEIYNKLSDKKWKDKYFDYRIDNFGNDLAKELSSIGINKLTEE